MHTGRGTLCAKRFRCYFALPTYTSTSSILIHAIMYVKWFRRILHFTRAHMNRQQKVNENKDLQQTIWHAFAVLMKSINLETVPLSSLLIRGEHPNESIVVLQIVWIWCEQHICIQYIVWLLYIWQNIICCHWIPWWFLAAVPTIILSLTIQWTNIHQLFNNSMQIFTNCKSYFNMFISSEDKRSKDLNRHTTNNF